MNKNFGRKLGAKAQVRNKFNPPSNEKGTFQKPREVVCLQPQFLNVFEKPLTKCVTKIPIHLLKSPTVRVEPSLPLASLYLIYTVYQKFIGMKIYLLLEAGLPILEIFVRL